MTFAFLEEWVCFFNLSTFEQDNLLSICLLNMNVPSDLL